MYSVETIEVTIASKTVGLTDHMASAVSHGTEQDKLLTITTLTAISYVNFA